MNKYSDKIFFFDDLVLYGVLIKLISSKRDGSVGERQCSKPEGRWVRNHLSQYFYFFYIFNYINYKLNYYIK